jgi:hypothetical protein
MPRHTAALAAVRFAVCSLLSVGALPRVAAAQAWDSPAVRSLVSRAIARRSAALADTALKDFSARAHGFVFFLGQIGEGLSEPPRLIKADQLELQVYWKAPNLSKQHIIGWRDRMELPTDIAYHRDHLGIALNNFPDRIRLGDLTIEFLHVTHSMPDCVALAIETPVGTIVHTGDFKIDQTPLDGEHFDFRRFAELGARGVLALFGDSTNIERPGFTGSETDVIEAFEEILASTRGKVIVAAFATSVYRMQILVNLAAAFGRKVAFVGRGMIENSAIAQRLGHLQIPPGVLIRETEVRNHPPSEVLCLTTGSQGEPMAALSRIGMVAAELNQNGKVLCIELIENPMNDL